MYFRVYRPRHGAGSENEHEAYRVFDDLVLHVPTACTFGFYGISQQWGIFYRVYWLCNDLVGVGVLPAIIVDLKDEEEVATEVLMRKTLGHNERFDGAGVRNSRMRKE